ncbi:MAG: type II toxin-antitoxin system YafQ family toxin [Spirochaetia bacterium]|nr:type II toxin-antitoxin system YafQ family toxin [Spirochaetia bacterium]
MKRGCDEKLFLEVLTMLINGKELPPKYNDHALKGNFRNYRDCHIQNDWVLIYRIYKDELILELSRTGTHSDLFKK